MAGAREAGRGLALSVPWREGARVVLASIRVAWRVHAEMGMGVAAQ